MILVSLFQLGTFYGSVTLNAFLLDFTVNIHIQELYAPTMEQ